MSNITKWFEVGQVNDFHTNMGSCVKIKNKQIAIFNDNKQKWYAVDNLCPHEKQMVLSRGIMGSINEEAKVACPLHKRNFSLKTGLCTNDKQCEKINTYSIKVKENKIFIKIYE